MSDIAPVSASAPKRRALLAILAVVSMLAGVVFAGYYAVRRAEFQTAKRHYEIALRFYDAGAVNAHFLDEMSAQILEAHARVPLASFDQAAAEHVARIEALRDKFVAQLPTRNRGADYVEILDSMVSEAREWQRTGKRPVT